MFKISKIFLAFVAFIALACQSTQNLEAAPISSADFEKAMNAYLKTESGQEKLGEAVQNYFQEQQKKQQLAKQKEEEQALEDQFKNPVKVDLGDAPVKGPKDAKVTIVEFSDFECPFCTRGAGTIEEVMKAYPKDVKVVFKNLPLPFHKNAKPAAIAALAAGRQGKFWEMHDILFDNQKKLGSALFEEKAKELGLDMAKFKKDLADESLAKQIDDDAAQARKLGISGTPGFVVGGVMVKGAYPFSHFKTIIDRHLKK